MKQQIILTALAFLLCIAAGAKAQTGEIGLELMWEKNAWDINYGIDHFVFSNDGKYIYTYGSYPNRMLAKIDANTGIMDYKFDSETYKGNINDLKKMKYMELTNDDKKIITLSNTGNLQFWDLENKTINSYSLHSHDSDEFAISPNSRYLYIGKVISYPNPSKNTSQLLIYDLKNNEIVDEIAGLEENQIWRIDKLEISNTGDTLFLLSNNFKQDAERKELQFALIDTKSRNVLKILESKMGYSTYDQSNYIYRDMSISKTGKKISLIPVTKKVEIDGETKNLTGVGVFNISNFADTTFYQGLYSLLINDSTIAIIKSNPKGGLTHIFEIWQNQSLVYSKEDFFTYKWASYEDESGFKLCIVKDNDIMMFNSVITSVVDIPELGITIYPNPAKDKLNIKLDETSRVNSIAIYDVIGRKLNAYQPNNRELNISNLPKGIYLLKIETDAGVISEKVVVE